MDADPPDSGLISDARARELLCNASGIREQAGTEHHDARNKEPGQQDPGTTGSDSDESSTEDRQQPREKDGTETKSSESFRCYVQMRESMLWKPKSR